eukprot:741780-Rhodomonas_salina.5
MGCTGRGRGEGAGDLRRYEPTAAVPPDLENTASRVYSSATNSDLKLKRLPCGSRSRSVTVTVTPGSDDAKDARALHVLYERARLCGLRPPEPSASTRKWKLVLVASQLEDGSVVDRTYAPSERVCESVGGGSCVGVGQAMESARESVGREKQKRGCREVVWARRRARIEDERRMEP